MSSLQDSLSMNVNVVFFSNEFFQCRLVTEDWWDCTDSAWGFCESWKWDFPWELTSCKLQNVQRLIDRFVATNGFTLVVARKLYRENCTNGFTFVATNGFIVSGIQKWRLEGCAGLIWRRIFFLAVLVSGTLEDFLAKKKPLDSQDHKALHDAGICCNFILYTFSLSKMFGDCSEEVCRTHVIFWPSTYGACCNIEGRNPSFKSKEKGT